METKYELKDISSKGMCLMGSCNRIYELCILGSCPSIQEHEGRYIIVGKLLSQAEFDELGLAQKVSEGEAVIEVPKKLIDERGK